MQRASGKIDSLLFAGLASVVVFVALVAWLAWPDGGGGPGSTGKRLTLYCAAGLKPPVEEVAAEYGKRYGVTVEIQYGGSGTLLSNLTLVREGDLYLAADESFLTEARARGLVAEVLAVAVMRPVIAVAKGNPKGVRGAQDLGRADVDVGFANPEAAAIGRVSREVLGQMGLWDALEAKAVVLKPTVNELANDLKLGAIDAAVIWDATAAQYDELEAVRVGAFDAAPRHVTVGIVTASEVPTEALRFARFLTARDEGALRFAAHGYEPATGDTWAEYPELTLFSGAMLNAGVDATITEFEAREGVRINRVYNGCGILVSLMRAGEQPDAYFSCDQSFMDLVADRYLEQTTVTANRMVLLVQKGNPKGIATLADLCRDGLKVGLAHPEKSALGALTVRLLEHEGLHERFVATGNLVVDSPTADYLVTQISAGGLDAVIVYRSNAAHALDRLDLIELPGEAALATQPYAVAQATSHPRLMERLLDAILRAESRTRFEELGFQWRAGEGD